jgi:hypothetical protein
VPASSRQRAIRRSAKVEFRYADGPNRGDPGEEKGLRRL